MYKKGVIAMNIKERESRNMEEYFD